MFNSEMHKAVNAVNAFVLFFSTAVLILELCTPKDCTAVLTFVVLSHRNLVLAFA